MKKKTKKQADKFNVSSRLRFIKDHQLLVSSFGDKDQVTVIYCRFKVFQFVVFKKTSPWLEFLISNEQLTMLAAVVSKLKVLVVNARRNSFSVKAHQLQTPTNFRSITDEVGG